MAVLRNGALRLALIATTTNTTQAARMFVRLSLRRARQPTLARNISNKRRSPVPPNVSLPDDIAEAVPDIQDALAMLGSVTRSHSATFRVALPDPKSSAAHGVALFRVVGYPLELSTSRKDAIQRPGKTNLGVNWRVALSGELSNIPDVSVTAVKQDYVAHRPNTKSELSVPVFVEDRIIGVVNLESPTEHAYDAHVDIAQAFAEHIGLPVANARLALSTLLQQHAIEVLRRAHELTHEHEPLMSIAGDIPEDAATRLISIADRSRDETATLRESRPDPDTVLVASMDTRFPSLVRHAQERADLLYAEIVELEESWEAHPPEVAEAVLKSLAAILDNARRHRARGRTSVRFELLRGQWGGQSQDVLVVKTRSNKILKPGRAVNVYRCPLTTTAMWSNGEQDEAVDEARFGAYLAGLHVRRIGGDVHLTYVDGPNVRVTVAIPSPSAQVQPARVTLP
jgi:hypothetical protein